MRELRNRLDMKLDTTLKLVGLGCLMILAGVVFMVIGLVLISL